MPTPEVLDQVRQLRAQLVAARPDSPEATHLAQQIDALLAEPAHAPHYAGLGERLRAAATSLEAAHPDLAAAMTRVVDALSAAGI